MKILQINNTVLSQSFVNYLNATNDVYRYALSINHTEMPDLGFPPKNYGDFVDSFAGAKIHVDIWIDEVMPDFINAPKAIVAANGLIQSQLNSVGGYLKQLATDPGNQDIIQKIKNVISDLTNEESTIMNVFNDILTNINSFQKTIIPDSKTLSNLISRIKSSVDYDEEQVKKLDAVNANIQSNIDARNKLATLDTIGNSILPFFLAVVGIGLAIAFPGTAGIIIGGIVGVGGAAFTSFFPLNEEPDLKETIDNLQNEMKNVTAEIGIENTTIGILNQIENQFKLIIQASVTVQSEVKNILSFWNQRVSVLDQFQADLDTILSDLSDSQKVNEALSELLVAKNDWNALENFMTQLCKISYTVQTKNSTALTSFVTS